MEEYFSSFWNFLDILYNVSITFYIIYPILRSEPSKYEAYFLHYTYIAVLVFISYRGLAYFRAFKPTRYLVKMIIECLEDMLSFIVLLVYCGLSFTFLFCALGKDQSFGESL